MIKIISYLCLCVWVLTSCDTMRRINMKNNSADTVHVTWTTVEDSIGFNPFVLSNSKELHFALAPACKEVKMSFGTGNWTAEYLQHLMKYLVSLEITSPRQQIMLTTPQQISAYLLSRRKALNKRIDLVFTP